MRVTNDGFLAIACVHALLYAALPFEWARAPWAHVGAFTLPALAVALGAAALRYWAGLSLGVRYTVHVVRMADARLVKSGPYRWMRHPIYRAVAIELPAIPLAFGCVVTALVLFVAQGAALTYRIRVEERALGLA